MADGIPLNTCDVVRPPGGSRIQKGWFSCTALEQKCYAFGWTYVAMLLALKAVHGPPKINGRAGDGVAGGWVVDG